MKTELKNFQLISHTIVLTKGTVFVKKCRFFSKNADISKIKGILILKGVFSKTTYLSFITYQISSFYTFTNWFLYSCSDMINVEFILESFKLAVEIN